MRNITLIITILLLSLYACSKENDSHTIADANISTQDQKPKRETLQDRLSLMHTHQVYFDNAKIAIISRHSPECLERMGKHLELYQIMYSMVFEPSMDFLHTNREHDVATILFKKGWPEEVKFIQSFILDESRFEVYETEEYIDYDIMIFWEDNEHTITGHGMAISKDGNVISHDMVSKIRNCPFTNIKADIKTKETD